jgi:hypothetical protein
MAEPSSSSRIGRWISSGVLARLGPAAWGYLLIASLKLVAFAR